MAKTRTPVPQDLRSGRQAQAASTAKALPANFVPFETPGFITRRQHEFICDLLGKRDLFKSPTFFDAVNAMDKEEYAAYLERLKEQMKYTTKGKASDVITALLALPDKPRAERKASGVDKRENAPKVPEGRYALEHPEDELNPVRFYRVTDGKDNTANGGKDWTGFQFVERFVSDDTFPIKGVERLKVLKAIAADPLAAAQRYGDEFERCCICNRGLTRRLSRKLRIGPVCLRKHGEAWGLDVELYISTNRQALIDEGLDPDENLPQPRNRQHIRNHA